MIEDLFPSKSFYTTIAVFFDYPKEQLHARLIARMTGCDIKCIHRQLGRLARGISEAIGGSVARQITWSFWRSC
jgi:hypothetical protein